MRKQQDRVIVPASFDPQATISWMLINSLVEHRLDWLLVSFQRLSFLPPPLSLSFRVKRVDRRDDYSKRGCINETRLQSP